MSNLRDVQVFKKRAEGLVSSDPEQDREHGRELVELLIRGLVDHPESIKVTAQVGEKTTVYKVECDQKCLGQIIGSKGKNIGGVRAVVAATMARKGIRIVIEIPYFSVNGQG